MKQLWATKSMQDLVADSDACNLNRSLGTVALTAIGIGAIIGTGIFVLTGLAAAQYAGRGYRPVVRGGGHRLRICWPLLRRVCRHGASLG